MRSSATTPPEFWATVQRFGPTGASQYHWRHRAGPAFPLLKPFLHTWPEPLVCTMPCSTCPRTRRVTNPNKDVFILEQPGDCDDCRSDRTLTREDLLRTSLNGKVLSSELGKALAFDPANLPAQLPPSPYVPIGSVRHDGMSLPVILLFTQPARGINLDAAFPSSEPRIILHLEMEYDLIKALQQRRFVPVHVPSLITPQRGGVFVAKKTLPAVLAGVLIPEAKSLTAMESLRADIHEIPRRTVALFSGATKKRMKAAGAVVEKAFTASQHYRSINWQGRTYTLVPNAAKIIEALHDAHRSVELPSLHQKEILSRAFGSVQKNWPSRSPRVQNFFRTGDAKRLWDDGFIDHDSKGNFWLAAMKD